MKKKKIDVDPILIYVKMFAIVVLTINYVLLQLVNNVLNIKIKKNDQFYKFLY